MLLSVFSFSPSASGSAGARADLATTPSAGRGSAEQEFAEFVNATSNVAAQIKGAVKTNPGSQEDAALNALLAEFSGLQANTALDANALKAMAQSIDAVLVQTSAANYSAELTDALETISAALSELEEKLNAQPNPQPLTFAEVAAELVQYAPPQAEAPEQTDIALQLSRVEAPRLPTSLFTDLQSNLTDNDSENNAELNALLALYQAPDSYYEATAQQNSTVSAQTQAQQVPTWIANAQAATRTAALEAVDVPEITLPSFETDMADAPETTLQVASASKQDTTNAKTSFEQQANVAAAQGEGDTDFAVTATTNADTDGEADDNTSRQTFAKAAAETAEKAKHASTRAGIETLAPLTQFAQSLQADGGTSVTSAALTPVVEVAGATVASYNANATQHVPRGAVADQVQVALKHAGAEGLNRITIQLDPQDLGRIDVRIDTSRDGVTHLAFTADRPETIDLLQRDARLLERVLQDGGMQTDAGNMEFHLRQQPGQQHAGGEFNGGNGQNADAEGELSAEQSAQAEASDELASLGVNEHITHNVHYGVNVQV